MTQQLPKSMRQLTNPKYKVGKWMAGCLYVHASATDVLPYSKLTEAKKQLPEGYRFDVVKYDTKSGRFSFIQVDDFVNEPEPTLRRSVTVHPNGQVRDRVFKNNRPIYHHKWSMVHPGHGWFNYAESIQRSIAIESLDIKPETRRKIGFREFWDEEVVPMLGMEGSRGNSSVSL